MHAHVLVIGGGVMGTAIALHLAKRCHPIGEPVVLLEKSELGAGSSGRSGAILRQYYADPQVASMARDSLRVWAGFLQSTGYRVGFVRSGVLTLAGPGTSETAARMRRNVEMLRTLGIQIELLEADEIRRQVPGLVVGDDTLAAFEPEAGFVHPKRALRAFATLARFHGATTKIGARATGLTIENGRVRGVQTSDGPIECERVVVAAGPWSRRILADVGIDLPLTLLRPQQHFLTMPEAAPGSQVPYSEEPPTMAAPLADTAIRPNVGEQGAIPLAHPVLLDLEHGFYARCEPEELRTRLGEVDESGMDGVDDPDELDEEVSLKFVRWARKRAIARVPSYADQEDRGSQAAIYTMTPDFQAAVGPLEQIEGLWVATGFSGHGFKLAPSIGEGIARMVLGEPAGTFDPAFFDPRRFREDTRSQPAGAAFGI